MKLVHPAPEFNTDEQADADTEALRKKLLQLGRLLHDCGERPTAQFIGEFATLPGDICDEMIARLEDFTRPTPELYRATGGDRFTPHLTGIGGGQA